jgi:hypothetical protein
MVAAFLIAALVATDPPAPASRPTHTRPLSNIAQAVVDAATRSSPTIVSMLSEIEQTDVIVYINAEVDAASVRGWTQFVGVSTSARFLEVTVNVSLDPDRRTEVLAHELQHVLEIARATDVHDDNGMKRLFERIGWREGRLRYETAAAIDVEAIVHEELWKFRSTSRRAGPAKASRRQ